MTRVGAAWLLASCVSCAPAVRHASSPSEEGQVTQQSPEGAGARLLQDVARAATGSGAEKLRLLAFGAATTGDRVEGLVHVPKGTCALFASRAAGAVEDLDLHVYGDDGTQFGVDESPDDLPTLLFCPEEEVRLFASARVAQGHGLVALGVQSVPSNRAEAVAKAVGARNFSSRPREVVETWPGLDEVLSRRRELLGGTWIDRRRVALPVDARVPTHLSVEVPVGRCMDVLVLPTDDVAQIQLTVSDENGRILARAERLREARTLLLCASSRMHSLSLAIRPYAGRGLAVAAISEGAAPSGLADADNGVIAHHLESGDGSPAPAGLGRPEKVESLTLKRGQLTSSTPALSGCHRFDLAPDAQLLGYQVNLWSEGGDLLGQQDGQGRRTLYVCAKGSVRLDAEAITRGGTLAIETRRAISDSQVLLSNPLAASRLLAEAHAAGMLKSADDIGKVTVVRLSETHLERVVLSIPVGHCQTVFLAGGPDSYGVEARILDAKTGIEFDSTQGHRSAMVRACAPSGAHLNAVLEMRTTRGNASALWASRQEKLARPARHQ